MPKPLKKRTVILGREEILEAIEDYVRKEFQGYRPKLIIDEPPVAKVTVDLEEIVVNNVDPY